MAWSGSPTVTSLQRGPGSRMCPGGRRIGQGWRGEFFGPCASTVWMLPASSRRRMLGAAPSGRIMRLDALRQGARRALHRRGDPPLRPSMTTARSLACATRDTAKHIKAAKGSLAGVSRPFRRQPALRSAGRRFGIGARRARATGCCWPGRLLTAPAIANAAFPGPERAHRVHQDPGQRSRRHLQRRASGIAEGGSPRTASARTRVSPDGLRLASSDPRRSDTMITDSDANDPQFVLDNDGLARSTGSAGWDQACSPRTAPTTARDV